MKKLLLIPALALLGTTAHAGHYDGSLDMEQSVENDHSPGVVSDTVPAGRGDLYGYVLLHDPTDMAMDIDSLPPTGAGEAIKKQGTGDEYGSILQDL